AKRSLGEPQTPGLSSPKIIFQPIKKVQQRVDDVDAAMKFAAVHMSQSGSYRRDPAFVHMTALRGRPEIAGAWQDRRCCRVGPGNFTPSHRVTGGGRPGSHRTWRADFPHRRSSTVGSQHCKRLQLPIREAQLRFQQRCPLFDLVEGVPSEATTCPAAAAQHLAPVTLDGPIDFYEAPEISGNTVVSIVAAKDCVDFADLFTDRLMSYSLH